MITDCKVACSPSVLCGCAEHLSINGNEIPEYCNTSVNLTQITNLKRAVAKTTTFFPCITPNSSQCEWNKFIGDYVSKFGGNCTGTLLNNLGCKNYLLTAYHCIQIEEDNSFYDNLMSYTPFEVNSSNKVAVSFNFLFESQCTSNAIAEATQNRIFNATIVAASQESDFVLYELEGDPSTHGHTPYYAGWTVNPQDYSTPTAIGIHHELGYNKRLAIQDDALNTNKPNNEGITPFNYNDNNDNNAGNVDNADQFFQDDLVSNVQGNMLGVTFDRGTVLAGSSGSALFDASGLVIGQLRGGHQCCDGSTASGTNDRTNSYGRFWYSWDKVSSNPQEQLKHWLSGNGSVMSMGGNDDLIDGGGTICPTTSCPPPPTNIDFVKTIGKKDCSGAITDGADFIITTPFNACHSVSLEVAGTGQTYAGTYVSDVPEGNQTIDVYVNNILHQEINVNMQYITQNSLTGCTAEISHCESPTDCNGSMTVSASSTAGGLSYDWDTPGCSGPTCTDLDAGIHSVTITDANACSCTVSRSIRYNSPPKPCLPPVLTVAPNIFNNWIGLSYAVPGNKILQQDHHEDEEAQVFITATHISGKQYFIHKDIIPIGEKQKLELNTSKWPRGIYLFTVTNYGRYCSYRQQTTVKGVKVK